MAEQDELLAEFGIDATQLFRCRPGGGYPQLWLPRWFPLEQASSIHPDSVPSLESQGMLGMCSWYPDDAISFGEEPPHWEFTSPWDDSFGVPGDDPRCVDPDASWSDLELRAADEYDQPVRLVAATYKLGWEDDPDLNDEDIDWAEFPLLLAFPASNTSGKERVVQVTP